MQPPVPFIAPVNSIHTDFRAETIAAGMLRDGIASGRILIRRREPGERPHTKDIVSVQHDLSLNDYQELYVINTNRSGLYDSLPENLFHSPSLGTFRVSEEEIIERIRAQRKEEGDARMFFAPFEQESTFIQVQAALQEAVLTDTSHNDTLTSVFSGCWPLLASLDARDAASLLYVLPALHQVREDHQWIAAYLSMFLGAPVQIAERPRYYDSDDSAPFRLGAARLDEDLLLNGQTGNGETDFELQIGPVPEAIIPCFTPGSKRLDQLQRLCELFFAADKEITFDIHTASVSRSFRADDDRHAFLDISTFI